jgi:hypothetical protein
LLSSEAPKEDSTQQKLQTKENKHSALSTADTLQKKGSRPTDRSRSFETKHKAQSTKHKIEAKSAEARSTAEYTWTEAHQLRIADSQTPCRLAGR